MLRCRKALASIIDGAIDDVAHGGEKLCVGTERRRLIQTLRRADEPILADFIRAAGLTTSDGSAKIAGEASMGEHRGVQAQPLEHLAHIAPSVVCVMNV